MIEHENRDAILELIAGLPLQQRLNFLKELWHEVGQQGADNHFWTTYNSRGLFACIAASNQQLRNALARAKEEKL